MPNSERPMSLLEELLTGTIDNDDTGIALWTALYLKDDAQYLRASSHWMATSEPMREALASFLGITPPTGERIPVPKLVMADYLHVVNKLGLMFPMSDWV